MAGVGSQSRQRNGGFLRAQDKRVCGHAPRRGNKVGAKAPATWTISTPQAYKRNLVAVDRRTLARLQGDRATLRECLRLHPGLAAAGTAPSSSGLAAAPAAAGKGGMAGPVNGLRYEKLSVEYKKAIQWALVRSGCSQRAFPMVHATLVYFTMKEMGLKPELNVLTFDPTNLGSILDYCADMDDHAMAEEATHIQAAFALSDMGDQKAGAGKNSITHNGATGYDHSTNSVWGPKHMSGMDVGKGRRVYRQVHHAGREALGNTVLAGVGDGLGGELHSWDGRGAAGSVPWLRGHGLFLARHEPRLGEFVPVVVR